MSILISIEMNEVSNIVFLNPCKTFYFAFGFILFVKWFINSLGSIYAEIQLIYKCFIVIRIIFSMFCCSMFYILLIYQSFFVCTQLYDIKYSYLIRMIYTQLYDIKYSYLIEINYTWLYDIKYSYLIQIIYT